MATLIACLSTGKGTWTEVIALIQAQAWNKVFLITNDFGRDNFKPPRDNIELILIDAFQDTASLTKQIKHQLKNKIADFEVALNLVSGSGKEHMALLESILELGLNFRLVTMKNNKIQILGLER